MNYGDTSKKLADYRRQIADVRAKMRDAQAAVEPQEVEDYVLQRPEGNVSIYELFGQKNEIIVIQKMNEYCAY